MPNRGFGVNVIHSVHASFTLKFCHKIFVTQNSRGEVKESSPFQKQNVSQSIILLLDSWTLQGTLPNLVKSKERCDECQQSGTANLRGVGDESCSVLLVDQTKRVRTSKSLTKVNFDEMDWSKEREPVGSLNHSSFFTTKKQQITSSPVLGESFSVVARVVCE